ncbi:hypothetical protein FIV00_26355 [Labrenzia sp. THAF82]|nr:hypothetical protein FIV00_26355 [Labrenzia sp. THAF82]
MLSKLFISIFALVTVASSIASASPKMDTSPTQKIQDDLLIVTETKTKSAHKTRAADNRERNRRAVFITG